MEFENEEIILQGAVDCMFQEDDEFVIVDYKTDRFRSISEMKAKYAKQLLLYSSSVKKCTDINVKQNILYLFYKIMERTITYNETKISTEHTTL